MIDLVSYFLLVEVLSAKNPVLGIVNHSHVIGPMLALCVRRAYPVSQSIMLPCPELALRSRGSLHPSHSTSSPKPPAWKEQGLELFKTKQFGLNGL